MCLEFSRCAVHGHASIQAIFESWCGGIITWADWYLLHMILLVLLTNCAMDGVTVAGYYSGAWQQYSCRSWWQQSLAASPRLLLALAALTPIVSASWAHCALNLEAVVIWSHVLSCILVPCGRWAGYCMWTVCLRASGFTKHICIRVLRAASGVACCSHMLIKGFTSRMPCVAWGRGGPPICL